MNIGKRFQLYRRRKHLTQKEAAKLIGVKSYQLANYESNRSEPSIKVLVAMSKTYQISIDQLLGNNIKPLFEPNEEELNQQEAERKELEKKLKLLLKQYGVFSDDEK